MSCCCQNSVAENADRSGTQRKGNVRRWKPLTGNGSKDVTLDANVCVIVNSKVFSRAVSKSPINMVINPSIITLHTRDSIK
jgi:hypothetical protein